MCDIPPAAESRRHGRRRRPPKRGVVFRGLNHRRVSLSLSQLHTTYDNNNFLSLFVCVLYAGKWEQLEEGKREAEGGNEA